MTKALEGKMEADALLEQKRPKYDETVLQKLEGDRQKSKFTEVKHVSSPVGDCWSQKRKKTISKFTFLGYPICSIIAYIKKVPQRKDGGQMNQQITLPCSSTGSVMDV